VDRATAVAPVGAGAATLPVVHRFSGAAPAAAVSDLDREGGCLMTPVIITGMICATVIALAWIAARYKP